MSQTLWKTRASTRATSGEGVAHTSETLDRNLPQLSANISENLSQEKVQPISQRADKGRQAEQQPVGDTGGQSTAEEARISGEGAATLVQEEVAPGATRENPLYSTDGNASTLHVGQPRAAKSDSAQLDLFTARGVPRSVPKPSKKGIRMQPKNSSVSNPLPSPMTKPDTFSDSRMLTPSELEQLRKGDREADEYCRKKIAERKS